MKSISTKNMDYQEWLSHRKESIGASDSGAVLGYSKWKTPMDVYLEKTGDVNPIEDNLSMRLGRDLEPIIKSLFKEESGLTVRNDNKIRVHPKFKFLTTNLDGVVVGGAPVEYKTMTKWTGEISDQYFCQLQHQMMVTGAKHIYFAVLVLGNSKQFIWEKYDRDEEFIYWMIEGLVDFWYNNVVTKIPPPTINLSDCRNINPMADEGATISYPCEPMLDRMLFIKSEIRTLQDEHDKTKKEIMDIMGKAELMEYNGIPRVSWKNSKPTKRFDYKALKKIHPEIYNEFMVERNGTRRFLIKKYEEGENE